jgi:hypothetical protein
MPEDNENLPKSSESLFSGGSGDERLNAFVRPLGNSDLAWLLYLEGYEIAAEASRRYLAENHYERDKMLFPIVFLYRHQFELCLKAIIVFGHRLFTESFTFPASHDLVSLWSQARILMERRWGRAPELDAAESQIKEMDSFDHLSFAYRYPVERDGKTDSHPERDPNAFTQPSEHASRFDLVHIDHFCKVARKLSKFLGTCASGLLSDSDENRNGDF